MRLTFFSVIAQFTEWLVSMTAFDSLDQSTDSTTWFFEFLESEHPDIWDRLQQFYADAHDFDDGSNPDYCPRLALYGWDDTAKPGNFDEFLNGFKSLFLWLSGQDQGVCPFCEEEKELEIDHPLIASWDFGPIVKFNNNLAMDGSRDTEQPCCRECAVELYKKLQHQVSPTEVQCWG